MGDADHAPLQLTILRQGDVNIVDLAEVGSLIPRSETQVDSSFIDELIDEAGQIALRAQADPDAYERIVLELQQLGGLIHSHLLTDAAREQLRQAPSADLNLRLDEQLVGVPWELCHDGEQFLADKFRIGRQVITAQPIPRRTVIDQGSSTLKILLVADPTETLPQASREAEQLVDLLDGIPGVEVSLLAGRAVRKIPLLGALQEHDVVHFAGHSHYQPDAPSRSGWRLAEGVLSAGEISKLSRPPALVFSNSCEAGAEGDWTNTQRYEGEAFGIGSAFLLAGVRNFVGTFWVVHDRESVLFAKTCYRALATGDTLGEALHGARMGLREEIGGGLTWTSYMLYGDPTFRPLQTSPQPGSEPVSRTTAPPTPPAPSPPSPPTDESQATSPTEVRFKVAVSPQASEPQVTLVEDAPNFVGRRREAESLEGYLARAQRGQRQVVFVSGPVGIGKTALVDRLISRAVADGTCTVARGQAVEQYGAGEAYLPVLEAWSRLCRSGEGDRFISALHQCAPSWVAQLPVAGEARADAGGSGAAITRERMLREMAEATEFVAGERTLVLVFEDLHWSDPSTLELISYLAQRREPARLLVVGTYRPADALREDHPLLGVVRDLDSRGRGEDVRLDRLGAEEVREYLESRLDAEAISKPLISLVHRRTDGHPLFMANMLDFLLERELVRETDAGWGLVPGFDEIETGVPENLRQMIERQIDATPADARALLEIASVAGSEFAAAAVAAAQQSDVDGVEEQLEGLAYKGQFLTADGLEEWPDGTFSGRYRFAHALYQNVLYDRLPEARRVRLHRRVGERKEQAYGPRATEVAGELAQHFEMARDVERAAEYHARAGENGARQQAHAAAIGHLRRALDLLLRTNDSPDRKRRELKAQVALGNSLTALEGWGTDEVERIFRRARELCHETGADQSLGVVLRSLTSMHHSRAELEAAREMSEVLMALAVRLDQPELLVQAHGALGSVLFDQGDFAGCRMHFEDALSFYEPGSHRSQVATFGGFDPAVQTGYWLAMTLWFQGYLEEAESRAQEAMALSQSLDHPFTLAWSHAMMAVMGQYLGLENMSEDVERALELADEHGFEFVSALGKVVRGWIQSSQGEPEMGVSQLREGLRVYQERGAHLTQPAYMTFLAAALAFSGQIDEAFEIIAAALDRLTRTGEVVHEVELHRLRGEILRRSPQATDQAQARECFERAIEISQRLDAKILELRAVTSYVRLLRRAGEFDRALDVLEPLYTSFTEGFHFRDLADAKSLIDDLYERREGRG